MQTHCVSLAPTVCRIPKETLPSGADARFPETACLIPCSFPLMISHRITSKRRRPWPKSGQCDRNFRPVAQRSDCPESSEFNPSLTFHRRHGGAISSATGARRIGRCRKDSRDCDGSGSYNVTTIIWNLMHDICELSLRCNCEENVKTNINISGIHG